MKVLYANYTFKQLHVGQLFTTPHADGLVYMKVKVDDSCKAWGVLVDKDAYKPEIVGHTAMISDETPVVPVERVSDTKYTAYTATMKRNGEK